MLSMHIGIHRYRTVLYSVTLYSTSSNNVDLLNNCAIALRNHQLHTELSLWRLIFLPLVFFVSRKFWSFSPLAKARGGKVAQPGRYPKPVKIGPRTTVWRAEDIRAFIENAGKEGEGHD